MCMRPAYTSHIPSAKTVPKLESVLFTLATVPKLESVLLVLMPMSTASPSNSKCLVHPLL